MVVWLYIPKSSTRYFIATSSDATSHLFLCSMHATETIGQARNYLQCSIPKNLVQACFTELCYCNQINTLPFWHPTIRHGGIFSKNNPILHFVQCCFCSTNSCKLSNIWKCQNYYQNFQCHHQNLQWCFGVTDIYYAILLGTCEQAKACESEICN